MSHEHPYIPPELTKAANRHRELVRQVQKLQADGNAGPDRDNRVARLQAQIDQLSPLHREWCRLYFWTNPDGSRKP